MAPKCFKIFQANFPTQAQKFEKMASLGVRSPWSKGTLDVYNYTSTYSLQDFDRIASNSYIFSYSTVHRRCRLQFEPAYLHQNTSNISFSYEITLY